jgi:hypothetical protein
LIDRSWSFLPFRRVVSRPPPSSVRGCAGEGKKKEAYEVTLIRARTKKRDYVKDQLSPAPTARFRVRCGTIVIDLSKRPRDDSRVFRQGGERSFPARRTEGEKARRSSCEFFFSFFSQRTARNTFILSRRRIRGRGRGRHAE